MRAEPGEGEGRRTLEVRRELKMPRLKKKKKKDSQITFAAEERDASDNFLTLVFHFTVYRQKIFHYFFRKDYEALPFLFFTPNCFYSSDKN